MTYRFTVISEEVENFIRELEISADATFLDLHKLILESCGYKDDQLTCFYICDDEWQKKQEVTLVDMGKSFDEDALLMSDTHLSDVLEDEGDKLTYVFDPMGNRMFPIELTEIIFGQPCKKAVCTRKKGDAPQQVEDLDDDFAALLNNNKPTKDSDLGEDFFGADEFDSEDFDPEGFEVKDNDF